jgi:alkyl sulfatase BDS1-like metallo-beta-lactamase superfamily hydrolase
VANFDKRSHYRKFVSHGVTLEHKADTKITLSKATLDSIQLKEITVDQAIASGKLKIEGKNEVFTQFLGLLDTFPFWFNIVSPSSRSP